MNIQQLNDNLITFNKKGLRIVLHDADIKVTTDQLKPYSVQQLNGFSRRFPSGPGIGMSCCDFLFHTPALFYYARPAVYYNLSGNKHTLRTFPADPRLRSIYLVDRVFKGIALQM